jgi:membrane protein
VGFLISSEVPIEKIKQIELTSLFRIFQNHSTDDMARKMLVELRDASQSRANMTISESSCSWAEWVQSKEFRRLFVSLYNDYVLGVSLNLRNLSGREIVKISWNDVLNTVATRNLASLYSRIMSIVLSLWGRLGLSAATLSVVSVSVDPGFSLHAKIMIPPDIRVEDASVAPMLERKFKRKERRDLERALSKQVRIRRSGQQVTLYGGSNEDIEGIDVRIRVSPRRRVFVAPAFVSTIMSFMTMLFLYHSLKAAAFQAAKLSEQNNVALFLWSPRPASAVDQIAQAANSVGSVVSTLAVLPALVASYVALRDEHDYVASLLGFRRGLLVFVSLISVFAALLANIDLSFPGVGYGTRTAVTWTALLNLAALLLFLFDIVRISLCKHRFKVWIRRTVTSIIFLSFIGLWCGFYFRLHDELLWGVSDTWHFVGTEIKNMFSLVFAHLTFIK